MRIGLFIATTNPFATPELLATVAGVAEEGGFGPDEAAERVSRLEGLSPSGAGPWPTST